MPRSGELVPARRPPPDARARARRGDAAWPTREGLEGQVSMRRLGERSASRRDSAYHHAGRKDSLIGALLTVHAEIESADPTTDWRSAIRRRPSPRTSASRRQPWAIGYFVTGPVERFSLGYMNALAAAAPRRGPVADPHPPRVPRGSTRHIVGSILWAAGYEQAVDGSPTWRHGRWTSRPSPTIRRWPSTVEQQSQGLPRPAASRPSISASTSSRWL